MGARASATAGRKRVTLHVVPMLLQVAALTSILSCRGGDTASSPSTPQVGSRVVVLVLDGIRLEESLGDGCSDVLEMSTADILPKVRDIIDNHGVNENDRNKFNHGEAVDEHTVEANAGLCWWTNRGRSILN